MKVAVRIRPVKNSAVKSEGKFEGESNQHSILHVTDGNIIFDPIAAKKGFYFHGKEQLHRDITVANKNLLFKFDDVFDVEAQNRDLFERLMKPLVHSLMDGYNCSFINYGATGTGKTYTILGNGIQRGLSYLTMEYVFFQLNKRVSNEWFHSVRVAYLEVYNEKVTNLLIKSKPVTVQQRGNGNTNVADFSMRKVSNLSEVQKLLAMGNRNRTRHVSSVNTHSNQSNTIFQVSINTPNNGDSVDGTVKLLIVELGGSERNATEKARQNSYEGANNSKPILTLKNCLHRLAEGSQTIPFNESQLTAILKNSLNDYNHVTVMLFNVSSSMRDYSDTYNTLTYANRAKQIGKSNEKRASPFVKPITSIDKTCNGLKRDASFTISNTLPTSTKSLYTGSTTRMKSSQSSDDSRHNGFSQRLENNSSENNTELTELTRWYYEIDSIYDAVQTAVNGYCASTSKEKLLELRLRCREDVENCRSLFLPGRSSRMATVRVESMLEEITKQANVVPNKVNYWKSRLQMCQQQLQNLHRKVKESSLDHILESYVLMKESEISATKAHHETMHIMKTNAIYVQKTEIDGYLSVLGANDMLLQVRNEHESDVTADIVLPLYKNCVARSNSKTSQSKSRQSKVNEHILTNISMSMLFHE